jgi:hypothetical protein
MPLSTFLDGTTQSRLRGLLWMALSDTGSVLTLTSTDDTGGGATQAWAAGSAVPCRIDPIARQGRDMIADRLDERSTDLVTVPAGTTVSTSNRFVIAGRGTYEVTATRDQTGEFAKSFEVFEAS